MNCRTPLEGLFGTLMTEESLAAVRARFHERHAQIHGHAARERPVELVSYRLRVRVLVPKFEPVQEPLPAAPRPIETAIKGRRRLHLPGKDSVNAILYETRPARYRGRGERPRHHRAIRRYHRAAAGLARAGGCVSHLILRSE